MTQITLYYFPPSGPSRGALLTARALGLSVDVQLVDLFKKEQLNESFKKINPQHCVPTLVDDGFILWESRAIASYLVDKFGKDDQLYPKDLQKRALIDQRMYFDSSNLYVKIRAVCLPILYHGETKIHEPQRNDLNMAFGFLDQFLGESKWLVGDHYTIADVTIFASISGILSVGWDMSAFPNIERWVKQCAVLPGWEENQVGAKQFGDAVRKRLML